MADFTMYSATRIRYDSSHDYYRTRARFDQRVPILEHTAAAELIARRAAWSEVEATISGAQGPTGFVAMARLDQGALLSLSGRQFEATLYLVGNPVIARIVTDYEPVAALYAPFRLAVFCDAGGVRIAYDQPSSVFASLRSPGINEVAAGLDQKIMTTVEEVCRPG